MPAKVAKATSMTRPENPTLEELHAYADYLEEQNKALRKLHEELHQRQRVLEQQLSVLQEQVLLARRHRFGPSSERTHPDQASLFETVDELFNEAEAVKDEEDAEAEKETITYQRRKKRVSFQQKLEELPASRTVKHELPEEERVCPQCEGQLHVMKVERRRELHIIPARVEVVEHERDVYVCRHCERRGTSVPIVKAPMPEPLLPGSGASASAAAYIMTEKFDKSVPLHRQEQQLVAEIELSRQTMSNWLIGSRERYLGPFCERMGHHLRLRDVLHMDETFVQVLREPGRDATTKSTMWLMATGRDGPPIFLFDYQLTRSAEHIQKLLQGYSGYLHVDGYAGYEGLPGVKLVGCWAHVRRKFDEALSALPPSKRSKGPVAAQEGLDYCNRLFSIERQLKHLSPEERKARRQELSVPVLTEFKAWLERQKSLVLSKSALGKAISYTLKQWPKLTVFLEDGRLSIDNNRAEQAIRPFVVGRKNWLFANTPRGAAASATIYSIVTTAKANNLRPYEYLKYLLEQLPNIDITDPEALDALMPWSDTLPPECRR